jgi:hypothetical protein
MNTRARGLAPVLALLVLAPWVGEYLLGNVSVRDLAALPFLVPLYGGGALLIREVVRRSGRGWPSILLLGMAYGVVESGLVDQSMFNPSYEGLEFGEVTPIPALGISAYNSVVFVVGHAVWSIAVPIAVVELWTPARARTPWLGRFGLAATAALYLGGCALIFGDLYQREDFMASPAQQAGAALVALALVVVALTVPLPPGRGGAARVPRPWLVGLIGFALASAFFGLPGTWVGVGLGLAIPAFAAWLFVRWSRRRAWGTWHMYAMVAGAMLTYSWGGFVLADVLAPDDQVRRIGNAAFAVFAVLLLAATARRIRSGTPDLDDPVSEAGGRVQPPGGAAVAP